MQEPGRNLRSERITEWFGILGTSLLFTLVSLPILNPDFFFPATWDGPLLSLGSDAFVLRGYELAGWFLLFAAGFVARWTDFFTRLAFVFPVAPCGTFFLLNYWLVADAGFRSLYLAVAMVIYLCGPWWLGAWACGRVYARLPDLSGRDLRGRG